MATDWMWVYENPKAAAALIDRLDDVANAATSLIEEISASGTHTRWKRTANAIHELNAAPSPS